MFFSFSPARTVHSLTRRRYEKDPNRSRTADLLFPPRKSRRVDRESRALRRESVRPADLNARCTRRSHGRKTRTKRGIRLASRPAARTDDGDSGMVPPAVQADTTTARAEASSSRSVPLLDDPSSVGTERAKKGQPKAARPSGERGLRELAGLTRDNFSAFEKPPTGPRRRGTLHVTSAPPTSRHLRRVLAVQSSTALLVAGEEAPAPGEMSSSLATDKSDSASAPDQDHHPHFDARQGNRRGRKRRLKGPEPLKRDPRSPSYGDLESSKRARSNTADDAADAAGQAAAAVGTALPGCPASSTRKGSPPPGVAVQLAFPEAAVECPAAEVTDKTRRRRASKRQTTELEMLQRDYYAAPSADLGGDSDKRTRRGKTATTAAETTSAIDPPPRQQSEPSAADAHARKSAKPRHGPAKSAVPVQGDPATASPKTRKRRAKSRSRQPPSEVMWLAYDHSPACHKPVQGKRAKSGCAATRDSDPPTAAQRAPALKRAAGEAQLLPTPQTKKSRRAVSPELIGPEHVPGRIPPKTREHEPRTRGVSPELFAQDSSKSAAPATGLTAAVSTSPEQTVANSSPSLPPPPTQPAAGTVEPIATALSELLRKRERERPARFAHDLGVPEDTIGARRDKSAESALSGTAQGRLLHTGAIAGAKQLPKGPQNTNKPKASQNQSTSAAPPQVTPLVVDPLAVSASTGCHVGVAHDAASDSPFSTLAALLPVEVDSAAPIKAPKRKRSALSSVKSRPKQGKPRARHPAFDDRQSWVKPQRDVKLRENGRPPIWCEGRQELCESLDYFKSYQGGHCASLLESFNGRHQWA